MTNTLANTTTNEAFVFAGPLTTGSALTFFTETGTVAGEVTEWNPATGRLTFEAFGTRESFTRTLAARQAN